MSADTNGVLLCGYHHRLIHEGGWGLCLDAATGIVTVTSPDHTTVRTSDPPGFHPRLTDPGGKRDRR